jgi:hypothetical protein
MRQLRSDCCSVIFPAAMFITLLLTSFPQNLAAQSISTTRSRQLPVSDTLRIDTFSLVPGSVILETKTGIVAPENYLLDELKSQLTWKKKPESDTLTVTYRVLPLSFTRDYSHKEYEDFNRSDSLRNVPIVYTPQELFGNQLSFGNLDYNGSFARGITFGNNQDLVVNSSFNLQLQGRLAGDVDVLAAMSDNNIPIQPAGNTQQIQDFDRIFVQFKKNRSVLTVGDYELAKPAGYFMNFYKKLQGANFSTAYREGSQFSFKTAASVAAARGKYARNSFLGQEGNQGPYRLTGNNGEVFIIILAGSERIFIDGELLSRGADRDYVIDYNAGEITFTPTRLITKDKRIEAEFQYSDQAYLRTTFFAGQEMQSDEWKFRFNFYSEQDAKNQPQQQTLTDSAKLILGEAGDDLDQAYIESVYSVPFTTDRPLYKKIDSLGFTIYVYSTHPDSAHFAVSFSFVGNNEGNYTISDNLVNGRVYTWVAPVNGVPQGQYEPVVPLIAPQLTQLITLGTDYLWGKNSTVTAEGALSNTDLNTFSDSGNENNNGFAAMLGFTHQVPLDTAQLPRSQITFNSRYEFTAANFRPLERYRPVEFDRDWNINRTSLDPANENLVSLSAAWLNQKAGAVQYAVSYYHRQAQYSGLNNSLSANYRHHGFGVKAQASFLVSESDSINTRFLRPTLELSQQLKLLKGITVGIRGQQENNRIATTEADTLSRSSFYWNEGKFFLQSSDSAKIRFNADLSSRIDYAPLSGEFKRATTGNTANLGAGFFSNPNSLLQLTTTFRNLSVNDSSLTNQTEDESVLGRVTYDLLIKKGFITSNTLLEAGSGQQPKLEYAFAAVPDGSGSHTWIDYNGDGIQQINEFEIAAFQSDADFIKVFLPTNEFIKAYSTQFNESFSITPQRLWGKADGIKAAISRLSALATFQTSKKTLRSNFETQFNPFLLDVDDSLLLSTASIISGFLYYNKSSSKFGTDLSFQNNRAKNLLTNGVEIRTTKNYGTRIRWNLSRKVSAIVKGGIGTNTYATEYLPQNNYNINSYTGESQLSFQPTNQVRLAANYGYGNSHNTVGENGEKSVSNRFTLDFKYNVVSKSELTLTGSYVRVKYTGQLNAPVAYAMLQGLQDGNNFLLNISFQRKLSNFLEIILSYEGRKTGNADFVNTGQAQVRAIF